MIVAALLAPVPARAYHEGDERIIDETAYLLRDGEWAVGMWDVSWAPWDWVTLATYTWPWFGRIGNLSAKFNLWTSGPWAVSGKIGLLTLDLQKLVPDSEPVRFNIVPIEATVSRRLNDTYTVSAGIVTSPMVVKGAYDEENLEGAVGASNVQAHINLEMRLSRGWAFLVRTRHLLFMDVSAKATTTYEPDEYTTVEVVGAAQSEGVAGLEFPVAFSVVPAIFYSGNSFNFMFGLGYGNFNVPGINFVIPTKSVVPELDMFWRW